MKGSGERDRDSVSGSRALGRNIRKSQGQEPWVPGGDLGNQGGSKGLDTHSETPKEMLRSSWQT